MINQKPDTNFQLSFLILILFSLVLSPLAKYVYFYPPEGSFIKLVFNSYIYVCLFFLPYASFRILDKFYSKNIIITFYIIILYGLFQILSNIHQFSLYQSIFGNPYFGPLFLVPLFFLWGTKINAIYWLNKLSLLSIKIGIFLIPITAILKLPLPSTSFLPAYYLLAGYYLVSFRDKIWIILGLIGGLYCFNATGYRAGVVVLLASITIFFIIKFKKKLLNTIIIIVLFILPIIIFANQLSNKSSIYSTFTNYFSPDSVWAMDTRTFITKEVIEDLKKDEKMLFGKGPMGTYYSEYFDRARLFSQNLIVGRQQSSRSVSEIGLLHYVVKGGFFYVFFISLFTIFVVLNVQKNSKNNYLLFFSLFLAFYFMFSAIENVPIFNSRQVGMWIIMAICSSNIFIELDDNEIKKLINNKN
tara:strand:- start:2023 stop:3267 length:1245 start_codon:yes stop_codon:yes gene_type:complete